MSNAFDLLSPDENENYFRVKQATKQGYILCEWGGVVTYHIPLQNSAEAEFKAADR